MSLSKIFIPSGTTGSTPTATLRSGSVLTVPSGATLNVAGTLNITSSALTIDELILEDVGRISTSSSAGASLALDASTATHAEGMELRWHIADWSDVVTWTSAKGMYLRMENREANASGSIYGAEIYGVANDVNTKDVWGSLIYAYVKGTTAKTITNVYAIQPEITFDASSGTNTITDACVVRGKVTGGVMSDYTVLDGYRLTLGDMDGGSRTYGNGLIFEDDSDMSGTCALTTGININIGTTTAISVAGAYTTGISLSGDGTTAINVTNGFSGTDGIILGGTHSDAGIEIDGTCADGIRIDGACSDNGIEIVGACTDSAIQVVTGGFATGLLLDADGTTGINITSSFSGADGIILGGTHSDAGIEIDGTCADGIRIDGNCSDNGIEIVGACTDSAIQVVTGGFATGLKLDADGTTGIDITSSFTGTTGIVLAGTATTGFSISGACTTGISLSGAMTSGISWTGASKNPINMDSIGDYDTTATGGLGNIIKMDLTGTATHTATTAGLLVKNYIDGETINGNYELSGMIVWLKHKATMSGGAKSSLASFHRHSSSTGTVDYGLRLFGATTTAISVETSATNLLQLPAAGTAPVSTENGATFAGDGVKIAIDVSGTTYYLRACSSFS